MIATSSKFSTDIWITISWEDYLQLCKDTKYTKAKFYYYNQQARIEMTPLGMRILLSTRVTWSILSTV